MKVIGHQAIGEQSHLNPLVRLLHQLQKSRIVAVFVEDLHPGITTTQNVVASISERDAWSSWHTRSVHNNTTTLANRCLQSNKSRKAVSDKEVGWSGKRGLALGHRQNELLTHSTASARHLFRGLGSTQLTKNQPVPFIVAPPFIVVRLMFPLATTTSSTSQLVLVSAGLTDTTSSLDQMNRYKHEVP